MPQRKRKKTKWSKFGKTSLTVAQFLLDQLLELGEIIPRPFETPYAYGRRMGGWPKEYPIRRVKQELKRMKDRGWIQEAHRKGKTFLKLTERGKLQALYQKLQIIDTPSKKPWDGKWRLAMFDIPEKGRRERNIIRSVLYSVGFYQLQKSVYIFPFEVPGNVIAYLNEARLLPFIRFIRADKLDSEKEIKQHFKL